MKYFFSPAHPLLSHLCNIAAYYGIGFGAYLFSAGLFLHPFVLIGAAVHVALGSAYVGATFGIQNGKAWGFWLAAGCSAIIAGLGIVVVRQSLSPWHLANVIYFALLSAFFSYLSLLALWGAYVHTAGHSTRP